MSTVPYIGASTGSTTKTQDKSRAVPSARGTQSNSLARPRTSTTATASYNARSPSSTSADKRHASCETCRPLDVPRCAALRETDPARCLLPSRARVASTCPTPSLSTLYGTVCSSPLWSAPYRHAKPTSAPELARENPDNRSSPPTATRSLARSVATDTTPTQPAATTWSLIGSRRASRLCSSPNALELVLERRNALNGGKRRDLVCRGLHSNGDGAVFDDNIVDPTANEVD